MRRRLELCLRFERQGTVDLTHFAEEFACSRRTIYRDLSVLRNEIGMEIRHDPAGGGHVATQANMLLEDFNQGQLLAVALAIVTCPLKLIGAHATHHETAYHLVRGAMEQEGRDRLDRLLDVFSSFVVDHSLLRTAEEKQLQPLLDSAMQGRIVEVTHQASDREVQTPMVVHGLHRKENGSWVVAGHSILAETSVDLLVSRIVSVEWQDDDSDLLQEADRVDAKSSRGHHLGNVMKRLPAQRQYREEGTSE